MFRHILLLVVAVLSVTAAQDTDEFKTFNASAMQFSIELFRTALSNIRDNAMMSTISTYTALGMLQQAAQPTTEKQITQILHVNASQSRVDNFYLRRGLASTHTPTAFPINFLNMAYTAKYQDPFTGYGIVLNTHFSAIPRQLDFTNTKAVSQTANFFMSVNSKSVLQNVVTPDFITSDTQLLMMNMFYMKYGWKMPFKTDRVKVRDFDIAYSQTVQVPIMRMQKEFKTGYMPSLFAQWLQIPLEDQRFYLLLLLPVQITGQDSVIEGMSSDDIFGIINTIETVSPQLVDVYLPKINFEISPNLTKALDILGLPALLDNNQSDLCSISNQENYLADAVQKSTMTIDENGIEFAAGTIATEKKKHVDICDDLQKNVMPFLAVNRRVSLAYPPLQTFSATHPFLAFVIDGENKVPLFSARIADPSKE